VGSALTEAENWDLFADCTSRDGRKILDAGVHLSDKCTMSLGFTNIAKEDTQMVSNTVHEKFPYQEYFLSKDFPSIH
jgi:hypothetical protein